MPDQVLIVERESLLALPAIQIIHEHQDSFHAVRKDLDLEEFVSESYPILVADAILNFLPKAFQSTEQNAINACESLQAPTLGNVVEDTPRASSPFVTPTRPSATLTTPGTFHTALTSRTITPGGTLFSPLSDQDKTPSKTSLLASQASRAIPSMLFSPPKSPVLNLSTTAPARRGTASRGKERGRARGRRRTSPLIEFEPVSRSIHGNLPKQTLVLRHRTEVEPLRDVFRWSKKCVEEGKLVSIEGWLIKFRDLERVRDILEVCAVFGLGKMRRECERTIEKFEKVGEKLQLGLDVNVASASKGEEGLTMVQEIAENDVEEGKSSHEAEVHQVMAGTLPV